MSFIVLTSLLHPGLWLLCHCPSLELMLLGVVQKESFYSRAQSITNMTPPGYWVLAALPLNHSPSPQKWHTVLNRRQGQQNCSHSSAYVCPHNRAEGQFDLKSSVNKKVENQHIWKSFCTWGKHFDEGEKKLHTYIFVRDLSLHMWSKIKRKRNRSSVIIGPL